MVEIVAEEVPLTSDSYEKINRYLNTSAKANQKITYEDLVEYNTVNPKNRPVTTRQDTKAYQDNINSIVEQLQNPADRLGTYNPQRLLKGDDYAQNEELISKLKGLTTGDYSEYVSEGAQIPISQGKTIKDIKYNNIGSQMTFTYDDGGTEVLDISGEADQKLVYRILEDLVRRSGVVPKKSDTLGIRIGS